MKSFENLDLVCHLVNKFSLVRRTGIQTSSEAPDFSGFFVGEARFSIFVGATLEETSDGDCVAEVFFCGNVFHGGVSFLCVCDFIGFIL